MKKITHIAAKLSLIIGAMTALALLLQGPGYQAGWWDLGFSFRTVFKAVVYTGLLAAILGLIGTLGARTNGRKSFIMATIGFLLGISTALVPIQMRKIAQSVPPIHDITTDRVNPPEFVAIAPLRANAPNPLSYDPEVGKAQLTAFPDIQTLSFSYSQKEVFAAAKQSILNLDYELVSTDSENGLIEATETSTWFGFKDDVVIRISTSSLSSESATLVDIRSKSRVGMSDLGMNARRIRLISDEINKSLN